MSTRGQRPTVTRPELDNFGPEIVVEEVGAHRGAGGVRPLNEFACGLSAGSGLTKPFEGAVSGGQSAREPAPMQPPSRQRQTGAATDCQSWRPRAGAALESNRSPQQQLRQQQQHQQQQQSGRRLEEQQLAVDSGLWAKRYNQQQQQHHQQQHHHYDCCHTESDLTNSAPGTAPSQSGSHGRPAPAIGKIAPAGRNNYGQNILLFAGEHRNQDVAGESGAGELGRPPAGHGKLQAGWQRREQPTYRPGLATGRFVKHYSNWRRSHSPTTSHYQNYSFHVPLQRPAPAPPAAQRQPKQQAHHEPAASRGGGGGYSPGASFARALNRCTRSRTVGHLPQLTESGHCWRASSGSHSNAGPFEYDHYEEFVDESGANETRAGCGRHAEEVARERQPDARGQSKRQPLLLSQGNLLASYGQARVLLPGASECTQAPSQEERQHEGDNPFRPGTELSWEADLMVKLMQRGYPLQQLPGLVQSAKQVAAPKSSLDLRAAKEVWAAQVGQLSRTKSLGRCTTKTGCSASSDSMDRLIASIELQVDRQRQEGAGAGAERWQAEESPGAVKEEQAERTREKRKQNRPAILQPKDRDNEQRLVVSGKAFKAKRKDEARVGTVADQGGKSAGEERRIRKKAIQCCLLS